MNSVIWSQHVHMLACSFWGRERERENEREKEGWTNRVKTFEQE